MDILSQLFHEIHIPQSVKDEIDQFFSSHNTWKQLLEEQFFIIHQLPSSVPPLNFINPLHSGETEALWLCIHHQASLFLVDDKDARIFATLKNVKTSGNIGILIEAKDRGVIKQIRPFMDRLRDQHSFWISEHLYQKALVLSQEP
jgi:predicted nucleic acid-binding protein